MINICLLKFSCSCLSIILQDSSQFGRTLNFAGLGLFSLCLSFPLSCLLCVVICHAWLSGYGRRCWIIDFWHSGEDLCWYIHDQVITFLNDNKHLNTLSPLSIETNVYIQTYVHKHIYTHTLVSIVFWIIWVFLFIWLLLCSSLM